MELKDIKELIRIIDKSNITEIEIENEFSKVKISKKQDIQVLQGSAPFSYSSAPTIAPSPTPQNMQSNESVNLNSQIAEKPSNVIEIKSPMVGTFYSAPSPDASPFVKLGDSISIGKTLCIIEAMKLMNEFKADDAGKLVKIFVQNGDPVEYNQVLFWLEK